MFRSWVPCSGWLGASPQALFIYTVHSEDHFWQTDHSSPRWETWGQWHLNSELEAHLLRLAKSHHIPALGGVEMDRKKQPLQPGLC